MDQAVIDKLQLPAPVDRVLGGFVDACRNALSDSLESVVLFGSAAEGRMRPSSDVNLILVLKTFEPKEIDQLRQPMRVAHAAIRLEVMFLLASEVLHVAESFGVKFSDILRAHVVLWGSDPFRTVRVERATLIERIHQLLFNFRLRLRAQYVLRGIRDEQLADAIADAAGPLRSAAAAILELEGEKPAGKKEALEQLARKIGGSWDAVLHAISESRERRATTSLEPGAALLALIDLCTKLEEYLTRKLGT